VNKLNYSCPTCGDEDVTIHKSGVCNSCANMRKEIIGEYLSQLKRYALSISNIAELEAYGYRFLGKADRESLPIEDAEYTAVLNGDVSLHKFLDKHTKGNERIKALSILSHKLNPVVEGFRGYYPIAREEIIPHGEMKTIKFDASDSVLSHFFQQKREADGDRGFETMLSLKRTINGIVYEKAVSEMVHKGTLETELPVLVAKAKANHDSFVGYVISNMLKGLGMLKLSHFVHNAFKKG